MLGPSATNSEPTRRMDCFARGEKSFRLLPANSTEHVNARTIKMMVPSAICINAAASSSDRSTYAPDACLVDRMVAAMCFRSRSIATCAWSRANFVVVPVERWHGLSVEANKKLQHCLPSQELCFETLLRDCFVNPRSCGSGGGSC